MARATQISTTNRPLFDAVEASENDVRRIRDYALIIDDSMSRREPMTIEARGSLCTITHDLLDACRTLNNHYDELFELAKTADADFVPTPAAFRSLPIDELTQLFRAFEAGAEAIARRSSGLSRDATRIVTDRVANIEDYAGAMYTEIKGREPETPEDWAEWGRFMLWQIGEAKEWSEAAATATKIARAIAA